MFIQQFFVKDLAHSSYLLGDKKTCAIIDPARDVDFYIQAAKEQGMKITHILETHLHADFISGHLDLAEKTKAKIYAPKSGDCKFKHVKLKEGDMFKLESIQVKVLEVPGHTPEAIAYVVTDQERGKEPVCIFSGDALFVGDVGRPDLFPGKAKELASKLYNSLHSKILKLPDFCEVYPAHGAGSLCGKMIGAKRTSTIGYEKLYNQVLQLNKEEFINSLIKDMPPAPDHFSRCSELNRKGLELVKNLENPQPLNPVDFKKLINKKNTIVVDIRNYDSFGGMHIPNAYHISYKGNFATFAGWIIPPEKNILLVVDSLVQAKTATIELRRVGIDKVIGFLEGGMLDWSKSGFSTNHVCQISAQELYDMTKNEKIKLIDVRNKSEYNAENIKGSINIPTHEIRTRYTELNKNDKIVLMCSSGNRSSLAASILKQKGFTNIYNLAGGMTGYSQAGYAKECPICSIPHSSRFLGEKMK